VDIRVAALSPYLAAQKTARLSESRCPLTEDPPYAALVVWAASYGDLTTPSITMLPGPLAPRDIANRRCNPVSHCASHPVTRFAAKRAL